MPQVFIFGIIGFPRDLQRNIVCFRVVDLLVAALNIPNTPRSDDRHFRRKRLNRQFKTNLIVPLARAAVANRIRSFLFRNFNDAFCNDRTCERRTEQIFVLIHRASLHRRINIILDKFLAQIFNV